jgi:iron complex transport system ATP-binding protein
LLSTDNIFVNYSKASNVNDLDGISILIKPGQITAIVGPNGSGKSTLIKALSRVLEPSRGSVFLDGQDLYKKVSARASAQSISVAPQDTHVAFDFNALELVAMGRAPYRSGWELFAADSADERSSVKEALSLADITPEQAARPVMTLSGGERQRVLVARSIVQDAAYILLDEPTSSLDLSHEASLFDQLKKLAAVDNKAVVVVLHDLNQAAAFADHIILLSKGKIVAEGPPDSVLTGELIWKVYNCAVHVSIDNATGKKLVTAVSASVTSSSLHGKSFYLICGGGGGSEVMRILSGAGASVNAGHLRAGDVDQSVAESLGIPYELEGPFDIFEPPIDSEIRSIIGKYDAVIFCPAAIGNANLASLHCAHMLSELGCRVYTFQDVRVPGPKATDNSAEIISQSWNTLVQNLHVPPLESRSDILPAIMGDSHARAT